MASLSRALVLALPLALGCNAIFGIDSTLYEPKDATLDVPRAPTLDAGGDAHDATVDGAVDAGHDARGHDAGSDVHDATVDREVDAGIDGGHDAGHDAARDGNACLDGPSPDGRPVGGRVPDPGFVECNSTLSKNDGGTCRLDAGEFCCDPASDASVIAGGTCEPTSGLSKCKATMSPLTCDEGADCPSGSDCCLTVADGTLMWPVPQASQVCVPRGSGLPCGGTPDTVSQLCKTHAECGPCGVCQIFCCASTYQVEACEQPFSASLCPKGPCRPSPHDGFQNDSETDIDCGGMYRTDASRNDASDDAAACGAGHTCKIGRDCESKDCAPADGGVRRCK